MQTTMEMAAPSPFDFAGTVYSHGWAVLAPNVWDRQRRQLRRVECLNDGQVVRLVIGRHGDPAGRRGFRSVSRVPSAWVTANELTFVAASRACCGLRTTCVRSTENAVDGEGSGGA